MAIICLNTLKLKSRIDREIGWRMDALPKINTLTPEIAHTERKNLRELSSIWTLSFHPNFGTQMLRRLVHVHFHQQTALQEVVIRAAALPEVVRVDASEPLPGVIHFLLTQVREGKNQPHALNAREHPEPRHEHHADATADVAAGEEENGVTEGSSCQGDFDDAGIHGGGGIFGLQKYRADGME